MGKIFRRAGRQRATSTTSSRRDTSAHAQRKLVQGRNSIRAAAQHDRQDPVPERLVTWAYYRYQGMRKKQALDRGDVPTLLPFIGYGSTSWVRVFARVLLAREDAFEAGHRLTKVVQDGVRGWRNFVSPPLPYAEVHVDIDGVTHTVRADRSGVVDTVLPASLGEGWQSITLHVADGDSANADIFVISDQARSGVMCDVDDTVVVTALPRPLLAAWNSFVLDEHARTPTPGMSVLLNRIVEAEAKSPVFYVSTGAWNVAQTLTRFLARNLYPFGPLLLTSWGPTEHRWFRSGVEHKVTALRRLAEDFPHITWILIGDDGQHDPEIYADFARDYPHQVRAIAIRQLTPSEALLAGGRAEETRYSTPGIPWVYGPDGATLELQLERLGILDPQSETASPLAWPASIQQNESKAVAELQQDYPRFTQDIPRED
ncbi:App1 family protein [Auritidibacter sp. NML120636]|uniref:App1 family protein n=1 Tax=Auritidibacter sp. NML120636 TaxID=2170743 RepID=UPI001F1AE8B3|nr:phosphatase domain-containing protein [Auritidibacter sp. NML120636]